MHKTSDEIESTIRNVIVETASEQKKPGCNTPFAISAESSAAAVNAAVYRHGIGAVSVRSHMTPKQMPNTAASRSGSNEAVVASSSGGRKGAAPHILKCAKVSECRNNSSSIAAA